MEKDPLKLTPGMILRRGHYGYFFCYWLYGRIMDLRLAGRSLDRTVFNSGKGAFPVQSISYPYIRALERRLCVGPDDVFVDVGCAWGRLLGYVRSHKKVKQLIGVELNPEVASRARKIFQNDARVKIVSGDILEHFPREGTVFYLFNPFDEEIFAKFIATVEANIRHPIKLLYLHPTCRAVLDAGRPGWSLVREEKIKPKHLGPLVLCVYEYDRGKDFSLI